MITDFVKTRRDGKFIDESMSPIDIYNLGPIEIIVETRWVCDGKIVRIEAKPGTGMIGAVVSGRRFVAMVATLPNDRLRKLYVFNCDGTVRFAIERDFEFGFGRFEGEFGFLETRGEAEDSFGVAYETTLHREVIRVYINAIDGSVVGTKPFR